MDPFAQFVDGCRFNSTRHTDIDTVLISRSDNQWSTDLLNTSKLGRSRSSALPKLVLPILADFTKGSYKLPVARADKRADEYSSDEEEEELQIEHADAPVDFLGSIADDDAMENLLKRAASMLDTAQDVNLINLESPLLSISPAPVIAPKKREELNIILRDLENLDITTDSAQNAFVNITSKSKSIFPPATPARVRQAKVEDNSRMPAIFSPGPSTKQAEINPFLLVDVRPKDNALDCFETMQKDLFPLLEARSERSSSPLSPQDTTDVHLHGKRVEITDIAHEPKPRRSKRQNKKAIPDHRELIDIAQDPKPRRSQRQNKGAIPDHFQFDDFDEFYLQSPTKKIKQVAQVSSLVYLAQPKPAPAVRGATSTTLIKTPTLDMFGLVFNTKYKIVICIECQAGFPFNHVAKHAIEGAKIRHVYDKDEGWKNVQASADSRHYHPPPFARKKSGTLSKRRVRDDQVEEAIIEELTKELEKLGLTPDPFYVGDPRDKELQQAWVPRSIPHNDQVGPIEGLRTFENSYRCDTGSCAKEPFPFCTISKETLRAHVKTKHTEKFATAKYSQVTVQTMVAYTNLNSYFEVRPGERPIDLGTQDSENLTTSEAWRLEQGTLFGLASGDRGLDPDLIDPVYHRLGMVKFWDGFNLDDIKPLHAMMGLKGEKRLGKAGALIEKAVCATWLEISTVAKSHNSSLLQLIMRGSANTNALHRQKFTIVSMGSLRKYISVEILLLRLLMHAVEHPVNDKEGRPIFKFDEFQRKSLQELINSARNNESLSTIGFKLVDAMHRLYFPWDPSRSALDVHNEPVAACFGIICLTDCGSPRPLTDVTYTCAAIQFAIRLRGFHYLVTAHNTHYAQLSPGTPATLTNEATQAIQAQPRHTRSTMTAGSNTAKTKVEIKPRNTRSTTARRTIASTASDYDSDSTYSDEDTGTSDGTIIGTMSFPPVKTEPEGKDWFGNVARPFCLKYLTEGEPTPYAHIRDSIRVSSAAVFSSRKRARVLWLDNKSLMLDHYNINLDKFRSFVGFQLRSLEEFLREKVLLGHTLDDLDIQVDFNALDDQGDTSSPWYSPLLGNATTRRQKNGDLLVLPPVVTGNADSEKLLESLITDGRLLFKHGNEFIWNAREAETWINSIHEATCRAYCLTHITQGAGGRVTEEAKMTCSNSRIGRRHLFVTPGHNTLCLFSNYWKGTAKSGTFKEVLRVIPYRVSRLLFILIRLVRPLALSYLGKHRFLGKDREELVTTYNTSMWATLGFSLQSDQIYTVMRHFFTPSDEEEGKSPFDGDFGTRLYRQFFTAVGRKHISSSPRYSLKPVTGDDSTGDLQAGRTSATSNQNYAAEKCVIPKEPGFIHHFVEYSRKWHGFLGIPTDPQENDSYGV